MRIQVENEIGREHLYINPYPIDGIIPTLDQLIVDSNSWRWFLDHIAINSSKLNWKFYRKVDQSNYWAFLYAFIFVLKNESPSSITSWQIEKNAMSLEKALKHSNILLSPTIQEILNISKNFTHWSIPEKQRKERSLIMAQNLRHEYRRKFTLV